MTIQPAATTVTTRPRFSERALAYMPWYPLEFNESVGPELLDFVDERPITLYVNIPFCQTTCSFCVYAHYLPGNKSIYDDYLDLVEREIELLQDRGVGGRRVSCIAVGGGTPNLLTPAQTERLCRLLHDGFKVLPDAELGMEGRPEFFTEEKLDALNDLPITRYNCGTQSFNDEWLEFIGRNTTAARQLECFHRIKERSVQELHMDLLMAMPGQTLAEYERDLETLLGVEPTYFNSYHLRLVPYTDLHKRAVKEGRPLERDPVLEEDMYNLTMDRAKSRGYRHFANDLYFTTTGEHRYVNSTWEAPQATIIALGANAMGITPEGHYRNHYNLKDYRSDIEAGRLPMSTGKHFSQQDRMERYMSLGFRRIRVDTKSFEARFGVSVYEAFPGTLEWLAENGYLVLQDGAVELTDEGKLYAENVSRVFYSARYRNLSDRHIDVLEGLAVREWNTDEVKRIREV